MVVPTQALNNNISILVVEGGNEQSSTGSSINHWATEHSRVDRVIGNRQVNGKRAITTQAGCHCGFSDLPVVGIGDDNDVCLELITVGLKEVGEGGRSDLFFAFDVDDNIRAQLLAQEGQRAKVNNDTCTII